MDYLKELEKVKKQIQRLKKEKAQIDAERKLLHQQLEDLGFTNLESAEEAITEKEDELNRLTKKIDKKYSKFRETYTL